MTVDELRKQLEAMDGGKLVVMSRDGEGNGFSPLEDIEDEHVYIADSPWSGDIRYPRLTDELRQQGYTEEDVCGDDAAVPAVPALVLHPVN
jgi:predicted double-glycine peptidase